MGGGGSGLELPRLPQTARAGLFHPRHHLPSSRRVCCWRQRGPEHWQGGERCARPLPCLFLLLLSSHSSSPPTPPPPSPGPPSPASPRAPPCKVESGVDVSESTWYRGWRIKSVELNSCHCSDSSRAERRGSERSSEAASKRAALGGDRERDADRRGGPCRSGRPRRGAGPGSRAAAQAAGPRPSQLEPHGLRDGRRLPSSQVSEPLRNSGGASATGSLFSACLLKGGNRSFSKRAAFFSLFFAPPEIGGPQTRQA